ncbi:MAG: DUF998 domain-containing protein [Chloroflexota bacterium]
MATSAASRDRTSILPGTLAGTAALRIGGSLMVLAGTIILLGIISAESLYPVPYSTGGNTISDLGGTLPADGGIVYQPSATIFDVSMIVIGLLVIVAGALVQRGFGRRSVTIPIIVLGIGALGVGVFPGNTEPHPLFAMTTFVSGGIAAVTGSRVTGGPFRWLSIALGGVSLLTLLSYVLLGDGSPFAVLGLGGLERWIVYPVAIWVIAFGGYVAGRATEA